jgi:transposase-like protein
VVSIKGAVLVAQNGVELQYRKKCNVCGHEDSCRRTAKIPNGASRSTFYCPNCRKTRVVEILGAG